MALEKKSSILLTLCRRYAQLSLCFSGSFKAKGLGPNADHHTAMSASSCPASVFASDFPRWYLTVNNTPRRRRFTIDDWGSDISGHLFSISNLQSSNSSEGVRVFLRASPPEGRLAELPKLPSLPSTGLTDIWVFQKPDLKLHRRTCLAGCRASSTANPPALEPLALAASSVPIPSLQSAYSAWLKVSLYSRACRFFEVAGGTFFNQLPDVGSVQ